MAMTTCQCGMAMLCYACLSAPHMVYRLSIFCLFLAGIFRVLVSHADSHSGQLSGSGVDANILLLTAHPDDECMFFAPTLTALLRPDSSGSQSAENSHFQNDPRVFSLCLSIGNADGLGEARREELSRSLDVLGIDKSRRWSIDTPYVINDVHLIMILFHAWFVS